MKIAVALEGNGMLADRYGKYAPQDCMTQGHPTCSFPISIEDVPENAASLALTLLDWDAVPVGGFCWIHWTACDIPADVSLIPENASALGSVPMVQGSNSDWSPFAGGWSDPRVTRRYVGPQPPDKDHVYTLEVFALDVKLGLPEGFYINELYRAMEGHVLATARFDVPSRA